MPFFDRFTKTWASTGTATEPSDAQANAGFAFLGSAPPTLELHNSLFQMADQKGNWLYRQIASVLASAAVPATAGNDNSLRDSLQALFAVQGTVVENSSFRIANKLVMKIIQVAGPITEGVATITFPAAFPTRCAGVWPVDINVTAGLGGDLTIQMRAWTASNFTFLAQGMPTTPAGTAIDGGLFLALGE